MITNLLKIAYRNILKDRFYSMIKVLGVSIAVAASTLIIIYLNGQLSYDKFHANADRIYRLNLFTNWEGDEVKGARTPPPLGHAFAQNFPEIKAVTRLYPIEKSIVRNRNVIYTETNAYAADEKLFSVFSFKLQQGDPNTALANPFSLVLSQQAALKYFGSLDVIGNMLDIDGQSFNITGVLVDIPSDSHLKFDFLISLSSVPIIKSFDWNWFWCQLYTYVLLEDGATPGTLGPKIPDVIKTQAGPLIAEFTGQTYEQYLSSGGIFEFYLQPLLNIHLSSDDVLRQSEPSVEPKYIYSLFIISALIILIACINFINLSIATSASRAKEVGVRKAVGALKNQLAFQFFAESIIITFISFLLSFVLVLLSLDYFNSYVDNQLEFETLFQTGWAFGYATILMIVVAVLSGAYPAMYLASFNAIQALKGKMNGVASKNGLRSTLMIFQFVVASALITCTLIINRQVELMSQQNLGFGKENLLIINNLDKIGGKKLLKNEVLDFPGISEASITNHLPGEKFTQDFFRSEGQHVDVALNYFSVDYDFLTTMEMKLVSGRNFSRDFGSDQTAIILNEAAVKQFDLSNPTASFLTTGGEGHKYNVIGVVKDFNYESLRKEIRPCALILSDKGEFLALRMNTESLKKNLEIIQEKWSSYGSNVPFEYFFLDSSFDKLFHFEQRIGKIITGFSILTVIISCIGLLSLSIYTSELRNKEMSIRKVLGSSVSAIFLLLSKDFGRMILIAFLISMPISYLIMDSWLQGFYYKISIGYSSFVQAALLVLLISFITVVQQFVKISMLNPIKFLKEQ